MSFRKSATSKDISIDRPRRLSSVELTVTLPHSGPWGMQRCEFIGTLAGGAVAALLTNRLLGAEKLYRIGYLAAGFRQLPWVDAFVKELQERGYSEGRNLEIEWREAKGRSI
jgi:hypothetical protein